MVPDLQGIAGRALPSAHGVDASGGTSTIVAARSTTAGAAAAARGVVSST
jgi:hypothetical protein